MSAEVGDEGIDGRTFFVYDNETADEEYLAGALEIPSAEGEAPEVLEVIFVCQLEERTLVAVPQVAWNRRAGSRKLPPGALVRATAVDVAAASRTSRAEREPHVRIKLWLGYLEAGLVGATRFDGELEPTYPFVAGGGDDGYLPLAEALVEVAKDKFQFYTAESGETAPVAPAAASGEGRLARLEATMESMALTVKALGEQMVKAGTPTVAEGAAPKNVAANPAQDPSPALASVAALPGLDPGVVQSALSAGVGRKALEEMSNLLAANPARRLREPAAALQTVNELGESDGEAEAKAAVAVSGLAPRAAASAPPDPLAAVLVKLTALVEDLHLSKSQRGSRLEQALDGAGSGTGGGESSGVSARKNSVARRALRQALRESPEEIFQNIEKLMLEDLTSTTMTPGMPMPSLSARAWLENRSRLTNYQASVRSAWGVGGILDCLIQGREKEARARACLMLVQADQVALDKGAWTLASEISLEQQPPFHSFAAHSHADVSEQPLSRLLEPRWAEIFLHHLQDTENYLEKRRKLQKNKAQASDETADPAAKAKAKAKA